MTNICDHLAAGRGGPGGGAEWWPGCGDPLDPHVTWDTCHVTWGRRMTRGAHLITVTACGLAPGPAIQSIFAMQTTSGLSSTV